VNGGKEGRRKSAPGDLVVDDVGGESTVVDEVSEGGAVEGVALLESSRSSAKRRSRGRGRRRKWGGRVRKEGRESR
jgi:hypothetical protein